MGFPRLECWSGLPFPTRGDLPDPEIKPGSPASQADSLPSEPPGKPPVCVCGCVCVCVWCVCVCVWCVCVWCVCGVCVCIPFQILFHYRLLQDTE